MEQFTSFVQEALEFLSLLRASEKERSEAQKKFMGEATKILKDLAESILKNNTVIKNTLEDLQVSLNNEVKKISENIGLENLTQAISALDNAVDLLQKGSTILDYKFTVQKTREILDEIQKKKSQIEIGSPAAKMVPSISSGAPSEVSPPKVPPPPKTVAIPEKSPKKPEPSISKEKSPKKPTEPSKAKGSKPTSAPISEKSDNTAQENSSTPKFDPLSSAMGTRTRAQNPRRVVNLKRPSKKIVNAQGEPIEIDTGTDDEK